MPVVAEADGGDLERDGGGGEEEGETETGPGLGGAERGGDDGQRPGDRPRHAQRRHAPGGGRSRRPDGLVGGPGGLGSVGHQGIRV